MLLRSGTGVIRGDVDSIMGFLWQLPSGCGVVVNQTPWSYGTSCCESACIVLPPSWCADEDSHGHDASEPWTWFLEKDAIFAYTVSEEQLTWKVCL